MGVEIPEETVHHKDHNESHGHWKSDELMTEEKYGKHHIDESPKNKVTRHKIRNRKVMY
jgi:hypothetical protein